LGIDVHANGVAIEHFLIARSSPSLEVRIGNAIVDEIQFTIGAEIIIVLKH
jgi:hypothetical protein